MEKNLAVARQAADALKTLAKENELVKGLIREKGGIRRLVALLHSFDKGLKRSAANALRTITFKDEEKKRQ